MRKAAVALLMTGLLGLAACSDDSAPAPEADATLDTTNPAPDAEDVTADEDAPAPASLEEIIAGDHRDEGHADRDGARNPLETLTFFGLEPTMTVVEIWPGGGYYAELIGPYVAAEGQYVAAGFDKDSDREFVVNANAALAEKLSDAKYGSPIITEMAKDKYSITPEPEMADMVLTFRNVHNWMPGGYAQEAFNGFFAALKPGGILGVVEHRGNPDVPQDPAAKSGYVNEAAVVEMAEAAGFSLIDSSEVNANPADTKDHPNGVWTLPPRLRVPEGEDPEPYKAIGESDRMTLKFIKPLTATARASE